MSTDQSTGGGAPASTGVPASTGAAAASSASSTGSAAAGPWPTNWRQSIAGENAEELKRLERFTQPSDIYKSFRELETRLSKGELKSVLPKDATPEQMARWRAENGIPADAKGYKINMPEGRTPPKEDDKYLAASLEMAHKNNYSQAQVDAMLGTFYAQVDASMIEMDQAEENQIKAVTQELEKEWGADAKTNFTLVENLLARAPEGLRDAIMNGYLETKDGRVPFRASKDAMNWLVGLEREANPASTVVPGAGGNLAKSIDDEIRGIEEFMRKDRKAYNKDEKKQARLRELYDARDKLKQKAA